MSSKSNREVKFVDDDPSRPNPWAGRAFPAIGPNGDLIVRFADTDVAGWQDAKAGQNPITLNSGQPAIHPDFARRGFVLYEDMCKGRIAGVEASPQHWSFWLRMVELRKSGREPAPGSIPAEKFYHPEVLRRRERASSGGGVNGMDAAEVAAFLGFGEAKPVDAFAAVFGEPADAATQGEPDPAPVLATGVIDEAAERMAEALPTASPSSSKRKGQG